MLQNPHVFLLTSDKVHNPLHLPRETTSERQKVVRSWGALYILTWVCASRHNGAHFFDISTSKRLRSWCALRILTSKCASRHNGVHFFDISTSKSGPNIVRTWCALYILTWKCASRHNGMHLSTSQLPQSGPMLLCFVHFDLEMCFAPQRRAIFHLSSGQLAPHPPL